MNAEPVASSFRVAAVVPEVCHVSASDLYISGSAGIFRGEVLEMCNGSGGYAIVASHRALDEQEQVNFEFAGVHRSLEANGSSEIAKRTGARYGVREVNVTYNSLRTPLAITLTVTPF
ncbi:hypothetical protein [Aurantiacibacter zhengii]|nr:hypothetical protein [Aurantiacibacter zhengii]